MRRIVLAILVLTALPVLSGEARETVRFVVHFDAPFLAAGDAFLGGRVLRVDEALGFAVVLSDDPAFDARAAADPRVTLVEPDGTVAALFTPNDPRWSAQYGPRLVGAPAAWDSSFGTTSVRLCVVDTGVRSTHEDLAGARYLGGYDFVASDADPADDQGHGTIVTGVAAATSNNAKGIAGMAQVAYYAVKVLGSSGQGYSTDVASGIEWCADQGAHVISMSLGSPDPSSSIGSAVTYAWNKGTVLVAGSGNDGCTPCVYYPAAYARVIAVGCVDSSRARCDFSNGGPELDVVAPGKNIESPRYTSNTAYGQSDGTSLSTPFVSGVAALIKSYDPALSNAQVRSLLEAGVEDLGSAGWDSTFGLGLVRADRSVANRAPVPVLTCTPSPATSGQLVTCDLRASDSSPGVWYTLDWGDGSAPERLPATGTVSPATDLQPAHRFTAPGNLNLVVTATDDHPTTPLSSGPVSFPLSILPNAAPSAALSCWPSPTEPGVRVACTIASADDSDGLFFDVAWGDGTSERFPSTGVVSPGSYARVEHTYATSANYTVTATPTDDGAPSTAGSPAAATVWVAPCRLSASAWLVPGGTNLRLEGLTITTVQVPSRCVGSTFRLRAEGPVDDFDVCWLSPGTIVRCDTRTGEDAGRIPAGATSARIHMKTGGYGRFLFDAPSFPDRPFPTTLLVSMDDGRREGSVIVEDGDDETVKRLILPPLPLNAVVRNASLHIYARASDCLIDHPGYIVQVNGVAAGTLSACLSFSETTFGWASFTVPPGLLRQGDANTFRIEKAPWSLGIVDTIEFAVDSTDFGASDILDESANVPGELLWRLGVGIERAG